MAADFVQQTCISYTVWQKEKNNLTRINKIVISTVVAASAVSEGRVSLNDTF